jgi:predicted aspartyl protease/dUTPase
MDMFAENLLPVTIMDKEYYALVDTGADFSVIDQNFYNELSRKAYLRPVPDDKTGIKTAGGDGLPIVGRCEVLLVIQGVTIPIYPRIVDGIISPLVIGMEFLEQHGAVIDLAQKKFNLRAKTFPAVVAHNIELSPGETKLVPVVTQPPLPPGTIGFFVSSRDAVRVVLEEPMVGKIDAQGKAWYEVTNETETIVGLERGDKVADMMVMERGDMEEMSTRMNIGKVNMFASHRGKQEMEHLEINKGGNSEGHIDAPTERAPSPNDPPPGVEDDSGIDGDREVDPELYLYPEGEEVERKWVKSNSKEKAYPTWDRPSERVPTMTREDVNLDVSYLNNQQRRLLQDLVLAHRDVFALNMSELTGVKGYQCKIDVFPGSKPVRKRPYRASPKQQEIIDKELDEMLANGIIEPTMSEYASPIVLVQKPDGSQRLCVDYRELNTISPIDSFPLIPLQFALDILGATRPKYLSMLDLASGYWQIKIAPEDRHKTAFCSINRHFQ